MAIGAPIDVTTPATSRRQKLAQQLQMQYSQNKGGQKQAEALNQAALHAMPIFAGAGGARNSLTLPNAPMPQLTVPFMQSPGVMKNLGVVNPAAPDAPTVSQAPGQGAPGFSPSQLQPQGFQPQGLAQPQPQGDPASGTAPQAGQGTYADGSQAGGPITDPNQLLSTFSALPGVRRLYGDAPLQPTSPVRGVGTRMFGF